MTTKAEDVNADLRASFAQTVPTKKRLPPGSKASVVRKPVGGDPVVSYVGADFIEALLVLGKDSSKYASARQGLLDLPEKNIWLKGHLEILLGSEAALSLGSAELDRFPHLLDKTVNTPSYEHCKKILHELADLGKLTAEVVDYLKFLAQDVQQEPRLRLVTSSILLQNFYGSQIAKAGLGSVKDKEQIKGAIKHFLRIEKPVSDGALSVDLLCPLGVLREFLFHSEASLRLQARSIAEAFQIPLELSTMISLSIDGIKTKTSSGKTGLDDLVFVIGVTGSGKSSLINILSGVQYELATISSTGTDYLQPKPGQDVPARVGNSSKSQTLYPEVIQRAVSYKELSAEEDGTSSEKRAVFAFEDTPGFEDSREDEEAICATLGVPLGLQHAQKIRALIVVVEWSSTDLNNGGRAGIFRLLSKTLGGILNRPRDLLNIGPDGEPDPYPIPLLFAISKPPLPPAGKHFDPELLRHQMVNRIREIQLAGTDRFDTISTKESNFQISGRKLNELEYCLHELDNFEDPSRDQHSKPNSVLSFMAGLVAAGKALTKGYIEQSVEQQGVEWLEDGVAIGCVDKLKGVLRQYMGVQGVERAALIEETRKQWKDEKEKLKARLEKEATELEELKSEKDMLDLMAARSDNIFIIRGFQEDGNPKSLPDHRDNLLSYLSCLRDNDTEITRGSFAFRASSANFDKVRSWADNFAQEIGLTP